AMYRVVKREGIGQIAVEEAPTPMLGPRQILVRNRRTLISRGSEIGRRYLDPHALDPKIMGYSAAGVVAAVGEGVDAYVVGQRVAAVAPHAELVVVDLAVEDGSWVVPIPDGVSFDAATFQPLITGALWWSKIGGIQAGETVAILGQGLVGNLMLQASQAYRPGRLIAVDALATRCALARRFGADVVIDAAADDPVASVRDATNGKGADLVVDCVGGKAGITSFAQALDLCRPGGRIHLIALYHGETLPLDSSKIQRKLLIGGYYSEEPRAPFARQAMSALANGTIRVEPLITHHFPFGEAKAAFDLLYQRPGDALGVILDWE
ncbi:MAG: zinc-dependent alcohol dehydrogenase, partial [Chloroflexota bacterium]